MITEYIDKFMAWYGKAAMENPAIALGLFPVAALIVICKALWLIAIGDPRGKKVWSEL